MSKHVHVHLHSATRDAGTSLGAKKAAQTRKSGGTTAPPTTVIKPTVAKTGGTKPRSAAPVKPTKPSASVIKPQAGTARPAPPSPGKPQHQPNTKPPAHHPIHVHTISALKHATEGVHKISSAIERHHEGVTDDNPFNRKTAGGVTTWGPTDPSRVVPKPADLKVKRLGDAGTSEGARKAAQTRAHGGGSSQTHKPIFNAMHYNTQADHHYNMAKSHAKQGGKEHDRAAHLHSEASRLNKQATATGRPEHVAAAKAATSKANAASKRLGHVFHHNR